MFNPQQEHHWENRFFEKLSKYEKDGLVSEVENTWRRYAHEALQYYDGHSLAVSDVVIN